MHRYYGHDIVGYAISKRNEDGNARAYFTDVHAGSSSKEIERIKRLRN